MRLLLMICINIIIVLAVWSYNSAASKDTFEIYEVGQNRSGGTQSQQEKYPHSLFFIRVTSSRRKQRQRINPERRCPAALIECRKKIKKVKTSRKKKGQGDKESITRKTLKNVLTTLIDLYLHITMPSNKRKPQYEGKTKFLSIAIGLICGKCTLRQIKEFLSDKKTKMYLEGRQGPSSQNTLADFTEKLEPEEIAEFIYKYFKKAWRSKRFTPFALQSGMFVAAMDGVETHHCKEKHCEDCLRRTHKKGTEKEWTEYYHREVVLALVGGPGAFYIDSEPLSARYGDSGKDSEVEAAKRLLRRLYEKKMLKDFDILVVDALYAKAPFIRLVESYSLIPVVRIKQENYNIMKDIRGLGKEIPFSDKKIDSDRMLQYQTREFTHLTSWDSYPGELRIVEIKGKYIKKKRKKNYLACWVIPQKVKKSVGMELIRIVGHWRWKEELNTFRSLKQNFKIHHLAHHHPVSVQVVFRLKCFIHSLLNLYLIRKLNPFTRIHYFLKDLLEIIKTNILFIRNAYIREIMVFDSS